MTEHTKPGADLGLLHIYCGDGKGKTTAALGLAVRAAGRGLDVVIAQFLKSDDTGELHSLKKLENVTILRSPEKFPFSYNMSEEQKERIRQIHRDIFLEAVKLCEGKEALLVLDELIGTYQHGYIDKKIVEDFIFSEHKAVEVVLTGRGPSEEFLARADYVSEIKKIKHPFERGISSRMGIEK